MTTIEAQARLTSIPTFASIQEEAEFWDTTDSSMYEHLFEEVHDHHLVPGGPKRPVTVRLSDGVVAQIARLAKDRGIGPSTLMRMWILEKLVLERTAAAIARREHSAT